MNIRSRGSIAVFLIACVFFLFVFAASTVRADSGEGAGGSPDASGPSVIVVGPGSGAGEDGDGSEGEPVATADPAENPGEGTDEDPGDPEEDPKPPVDAPEDKDGEGLEDLPELETVSNSGAAVYRVPIYAPPGRRGIGPKLFLSYNSRRGDGPAGVGWTLELGAIQRSTRHGVDYGAKDFFVLSAGVLEELVPREAGWGSGCYGAKIEETFVKYRYDGSGWEAIDRDGTRYFYGTSASSRQAGPEGVFKWCLDAVEDSNGNRMEVRYLSDGGQLYPQSVSWPGSPGTVETVCSWEGRPDVRVRYDTGFRVSTAKRLQGIGVYAGSRLAAKYVLEYGTGSFGAASLLNRVRRFGSDGTTELPALRFGYRAGGTGGFDKAVREAVMDWNILWGEEAPEVHWIHADGDGRSDLLVTWEYREEGVGDEAAEKRRRAEVYQSVGGGKFGYCLSLDRYLSDPEKKILTGDVNGDGRTDLFLAGGDKPIRVEGYVSAGGGSYGSWKAWELNSYEEDYTFHFADVNGDGYDDLIAFHWRTQQYFLYRSDGKGAFEESPWRSGTFPRTTGYSVWVDLNGDGLADCAGVEPGVSGGADTVSSWLNDGRGGLVRSGELRVSRLLRILDVNGDGLPDLVAEAGASG